MLPAKCQIVVAATGHNPPITKSHYIAAALLKELKVAPLVVGNSRSFASVCFDAGRLSGVVTQGVLKLGYRFADADCIRRNSTMRTTKVL